MGKMISNDVLDAAHAELATAIRQTVCTDEPADFADIAVVALAERTLTPGLGNGHFTASDGDVSGRKVTIAQQTDIPIDVTGEADHIAYDDGVVLLGVTTCTPQQLTSGGTVTVPAHDFEIQDPA